MANSGRAVTPESMSDMSASPAGTDRPTPAEMRDPGAHDRGGWLTVDEAVKQFGVDRDLLIVALNEGRIAGRPVAEEGLSPENADVVGKPHGGEDMADGVRRTRDAADAVVPEGQTPPTAPRDEWLVQPEQVQKLLSEQKR